MKRIVTPLIAATLTLTYIRSEEPIAVRPVTSTVTISAGSSHMADTYLSPLKYSGWSLGAAYERMQAMKWCENQWVTQLNIKGHINRGVNPAGNATMWGIEMSASWGALYRMKLPYGITIACGGATRAEGGCLYNSRNSNNPASAKAALTIDATAYATWRFKAGRLPILLRYQPTLPIAGAFFSPSYDELYFEIYMGNHHGLIHPAWWGNRFKLDQMLTADLLIGSSALRIGYETSWMSSKAEGLTTRLITHRFLVGWTTEWLSVNPRKSSTERARIISALY